MEKTAALLIFIEPTPYILGLLSQIAEQSTFRVDIGFLGVNLSQSWDLPTEGVGAFLMPQGIWRTVRMLARKLSTECYTVMHLAGWGHPILIVAMLLGWYYRVPVFLESDTPIPFGTPLWKRLFKRIVYPFIFRIPKTVLPAGTRQALYFRQYGVPSRKIRLAQMTVDVTRIIQLSDQSRILKGKDKLRFEFGLAENQTVFIFVGRLESYKGIEDLLGAFGELSREMPNIALLIVGDGSQREKVAAASIRNPTIRYLGRLESEEVVRAYNAADVAVLPASFEPWGLVVNEAMASGLPVIVSDRVGCADDLVKVRRTGLIFPAECKAGLKDAMQYMVENPADRKKMGNQGRQLISSWTLENWATNIVDAWTHRDSA